MKNESLRLALLVALSGLSPLALGCGSVAETSVSHDEVYGVELPPVEPPEGFETPEESPPENPPIVGVPFDEPVEPGPRIVVLLHGMLTNGGDPGNLDTGRGYWSFEFTRGLLGANAGSIQTLAGSTISNHEDWVAEGASIGRISANTAPHTFAFLPAASTHRPSAGPIVGLAAVEEPPLLSVMMTSRDASVGLLRQSRFAADQIESLVAWYRDVRFADYFDQCNCEPQLVLVGHSMGGLVIRTILSNPTVSATNATLNPDAVSYSNATHTTMDWIRDRTLFAATLATPHDGSIFAERGQALIALAEQLPQTVAGAATSDPLVAGASATLREVLRRMGQSAPTEQQLANATTRFVIANNPARGAIRDLTRTYLSAANASFLDPDEMRRTAAADDALGAGTGNALIPIYTFGGRSPGSVHFDTFDLNAAVAGLSSERPNDQSNILLKLAIDQWMSKYPDGYGATTGALAPFASQIDRVARVSYEPALADVAENVAETAISDLARLAILVGGDDVPSWVRAAIGVQLAEAEIDFPIFLTEQWAVDMNGSVDLDVPVLRCGSLTLDVSQISGLTQSLITLATDHATTLQNLVRGGASLQTIVATLNSFVSFGKNAATLLSSTLSAVFGGTRPDAACLLPTGWTLSLETRSFPAPVLAPTGAPISDGEIDSDGAVPYDSAMGLSLGGLASFGNCGAWQRRFDSPFEVEYHEGLNIRGHLGRYLHDELITVVGASACGRTR